VKDQLKEGAPLALEKNHPKPKIVKVVKANSKKQTKFYVNTLKNNSNWVSLKRDLLLQKLHCLSLQSPKERKENGE